jgi:PAS domain S-box-containing protein
VTVGVYENAPKVFTSEDGHPSGIFIDIIEFIAKNEGWKLNYVSGTWAEGLDRLAQGKIDLMPDVAYTAAREKRFSFHKVQVLSSWFQAYARKGSGIQSLLDLDGKRIAVLDRSVQQEAFSRFIEGFKLNIDLVTVPDYETMFEIVANGEADAAITNHFYGTLHARKYGLVDTAIVFEPSALFFATTKGTHKQLLNTIDNYMRDMKKDPQSMYYRTLKRWTSEEVRFKLPVWLQILGLAAGIALLVSFGASIVLKRKINARTHELRQSEQKYRELVQNANSIILRWNRYGNITFINEYGQDFFGYSEAEIIGQHVVGTIVPHTESTGRDLRPLMEQITVNPKAFEHNINENMRRDGSRVWVAWTNKAVFDQSGQIIEVFSIGSDITERKQAEEELKKYREHLEVLVKERTNELEKKTKELQEANIHLQEVDRLKSVFLATMSHELRTPLNSIIGFSGILLQEMAGPLNEEQKKQLGMVCSSAEHLLDLINDVLDISKIEAGQLTLASEQFDLRSAFTKAIDTATPMAEKKGLALKCEIAPKVGMITSDRRRVEQIILNLLSNAIKFTEQGWIHAACLLQDDHVSIRIMDTGIGIKHEDLEKLFRPFQQVDSNIDRQREGTGLGLSISKKLLEMLGGTIHVESKWGKGSSFGFTLPIERKSR